MKKKLFILLAIFLVIILGSTFLSLQAKKRQNHDTDDFTIVTSFYPMYILSANIAKDVPNVSVVNLTENQTGCLHDYQLTTQDMVKLNSADLLVMNGGGMEGFVENILTSYPDLKTVTASDGIDFLPSTEEHDHEHEEEADNDHDHETEAEHEDEHDHENETKEAHTDDHEHEDETQAGHHEHHHGDDNAHVWMNMDYYLLQMKNVRDAFVQNDPEHKELYDENYEKYKQQIEEVKKEYTDTLQKIVNQDVVIFHDAFAYLAQEIGLNVVYTINMDSDTYLSAGEVKQIIDEVNLHQVKVLFTEEQFTDSIAKSIAKETDAKVYVIDSLVTGDSSLDSYISGMRNNLKVLKEALY